MNVAVITSGYLPVPPSKGGAVENIIYNIIKKNEKYGKCKFTIFSIDDDSNEKFNNTFIKYIRTSSVSKFLDKIVYYIAKNVLRKKHLISYRYFFQRMEFMRQVGKELSLNNYDRVLLENNVVMFKALKFRDNFNKYSGKIYYHAHNEIGMSLGFDKYLVNLKKIIGVSEYIINCYKKRIGASNVDYIALNNAIDEEIFSKRLSDYEKIKIKKELNINNDYPILLFTGRISEEKGILELLTALSKIDKDDYNLLILGKSFYDTNIKDDFEIKLKSMSKNIKGNVLFTGMINYCDMYKYYQLADICILPSTWNEPCALTVIEAIVSGIPLITTDTGGTAENTTEYTILLKTENLIDELKNSITQLINNPEELKKLKNNSSLVKYKHGTLDEYYNKFIKAIDIN